MPELQIGLSVIDRDEGNFPKVSVVNMYAEKVETEPNVSLQSRPGLTADGDNIGTGPIRTIFRSDGVLDGGQYAVSGSDFYRGATYLGAVANDGTNHFVIGGFQNRIFVTGGTTLYQYDQTIYSTVTTPDSFDTLSLCVGSDRLIVIDSGTGRFYWSDVLSPTIQTLSFATAENSPDNLKDCLFCGDTLILFGSETVEQWPASSADPNLPFTPLVGRTYQTGIRGTGCATLFSDTFAWITNNNQVCISDPNTVVSTPSIEEKIADSTTARIWPFVIEGMEFLALTLDTKTYVFSTTSSMWSEFSTPGKTNWIARCFDKYGIFGSAIDGTRLKWSTDYSDLGTPIERKATAGTPVTSGTVAVNRLSLRANTGHTTYLSGTYANPTIEIRTSRNGGFDWSEWKQKSLGEQGKYRKPLVWRSLGYFGAPSVLVEIRVTDPVPFRLSGAYVNEEYADL